MGTTITSNDICKMVGHWLQCPLNGYLGSGYGQDLKALLQRSLSDGDVDAFLVKLRRDILLLSGLPANQINVYSVQTPPDKIEIVIELAGQIIRLPGG